MNDEQSTLSDQALFLVNPLEKLIENNAIAIPILPEVANKALLLAQNSESDASEMAKLIQSDQSLAGHMMRIANSVAYTPLANLVSLQQAIARLGMGVISEIALSASIGAKFFDTPGFENYVNDIWLHALGSALWAKEIARHLRSNVEVAFLAGLLHSIGRPAIIQAILDLSRQKQTLLSENDIFQLEYRYCHQLSDVVVKAWKMPTLIIEAVSYYDKYNNTPSGGNQAAIVNAGTQFSRHMLAPDKIDKDTLFKLPVMTTLNLYQDELEKILDQTDNINGRLKGLSS